MAVRELTLEQVEYVRRTWPDSAEWRLDYLSRCDQNSFDFTFMSHIEKMAMKAAMDNAEKIASPCTPEFEAACHIAYPQALERLNEFERTRAGRK